MNQTEKNIIQALQDVPRQWKKVKDDLDNLVIRKTHLDAYAIYYNGICTGVFIDGQRVDLEELKQTNWTYDSRIMEH